MLFFSHFMKKESTNSTMLVISMGFLLMNLAFNWHWAAIVSFSVGLVGVFSPSISRMVEWLWLRLAEILSRIVPVILLTIVFYAVLYPISILSSLFRKDPLMLSADRKTFFVEMDKKITSKDLENTW